MLLAPSVLCMLRQVRFSAVKNLNESCSSGNNKGGGGGELVKLSRVW